MFILFKNRIIYLMILINLSVAVIIVTGSLCYATSEINFTNSTTEIIGSSAPVTDENNLESILYEKSKPDEKKEPDTTQVTFNDEIKEHFFLADEFFKKKDYVNALIEYNNIRYIDPSYVEGFIFPAKCYFNMHKFLEASYYTAYTLYLDPENQEARELMAELKNKGIIEEVKDDKLCYVVQAGENFDQIVFRAYGASRYAKVIIDENKGKSSYVAGDRITLPLDFGIITDVKRLKKFDGTALQGDLERLKEAIIEEKEKNLKPDDNEGLYLISLEYLKIKRDMKALIAYENVCFADSKYIDKKNSEFLTKAMEAVKKHLEKEPKSARGYFYMGFLQFLGEDFKESLSNLAYSISLGLEDKYLTHAFKYNTLCRKSLKDKEAREIERAAMLKATADASASKEIVKVMQATVEPSEDERESDKPKEKITSENFNDMTKEQKSYFCYQQRKKIEDAIKKYNENNIIEMTQENFAMSKLREQGYLTEDIKCPDGGNFYLNHNGYVECSTHGL